MNDPRQAQVNDRAMRVLGQVLPVFRKWFEAELAAGATPEEAAKAMGLVFAHAAAGVASLTPEIEGRVVDWLTWEIRNQALELLAGAVPRNIVRGPGP